jgi:hypothetical protein
MKLFFIHGLLGIGIWGLIAFGVSVYGDEPAKPDLNRKNCQQQKDCKK